MGECISSKYRHTLLLVDDESSILAALQRLFRRKGYAIITAQSGQAGLDTLSKSADAVSLIISDQRMPGMSGSQFLEKASEIAPHAMRFTLTGYADINAVIDAVNKGKIHRYITKPWNDQEMIDQVQEALDQVELRLENQRLRELTACQNRELKLLNTNLEQTVEERTWALKIQNKQLQNVNRGLEKSLVETVRLLVSLVESSNPQLAGRMKSVAKLAGELAADAGEGDAELEKIEMAGLLLDIGLLGMPAEIIEKDARIMSSEEFHLYSQHPLIACMSLSSVGRLRAVSELVRWHHENVDGTGFPDQLTGDRIPLGSKILAVAADYQMILHAWPRNIQRFLSYARRYLDAGEIRSIDISDEYLREIVAEKIIENNIGRRYDLGAARLLLKRSSGRRPYQGVLNLPFQALTEGMVLMQDLRLGDGRLLLNKGSVLNERSIQSLRGIGDRELIEGSIQVAESENSAPKEDVRAR